MPKSIAQKMANRRYRDKVYDQITFEVPKGRRDEYKTAANNLKLTFRALIQYGIEEFIARHSGKEFDWEDRQVAESEKFSKADKQLLEEFSKLPSEAQKSFLKAFKAINESKGGD